MGSATLLFLLLLAFIGYSKERTIVNLQSIFCIVWGFMSFTASLQLYGMKDFSNNVYLVIILGCIGFSIGYFIKPTPVFERGSFSINDSYVVNEKWFNILYWISTIFMLYFTVKVTILLLSGVNYSVIRDIFTYTSEDSLFSSKFEMYIQNFALFALAPLYIVFLVLHLLKIYTLTKYQVIKIIILTVSFTFVTGSRITITNAIMQMICLYFMLGLEFPKKYLRNVVIVLAALVFSISLISDGREKEHNGIEWSKEKTYYSYGTISLPMCDYYMKLADRGEGDRIYGGYYISGFANGIFRPLGLLGVPRPDFLKHCDKYNEMIDEYIMIFEGKVNNAFVSAFLYFYLDFGYFGVFLLSLIFGLILKKLYINCLYKSDLRSVLLFAIILIAFTKSFMRWEFVKLPYCLSFLYVYLITKKNNLWEMS